MQARHVFCPLLILTLWIHPASGQVRQSRNSFSIAGTVRDDTDEHSLESVRVDLKQATGILINTTFTRGNGEFEFAGLANGEYFLEIDLKGYEPYRESVSTQPCMIAFALAISESSNHFFGSTRSIG